MQVSHLSPSLAESFDTLRTVLESPGAVHDVFGTVSGASTGQRLGWLLEAVNDYLPDDTDDGAGAGATLPPGSGLDEIGSIVGRVVVALFELSQAPRSIYIISACADLVEFAGHRVRHLGQPLSSQLEETEWVANQVLNLYRVASLFFRAAFRSALG